MRIGLYHQHSDEVVGGAEAVVAVMAECLSLDHAVTIVHHKDGLSTRYLSETYGVCLDGVDLRHTPLDLRQQPFSSPIRRYSLERRRYAEALAGFDLIIASVHTVPPFCPARRGALYVHFPSSDLMSVWPWKQDGGGLRRRLRRVYARWERDARFASYQVVMVNSDFTRRFTRQWWGRDADVVFAPAGIMDLGMAKQDRLLSVGRFASRGTSKHQLELVRAFGEVERAGRHGWAYDVVGGLGPSESDIAYHRDVLAAAEGYPIRVVTNLARPDIEAHYRRSRIFWHAAGLGAGESHPDLLEHFGIVSVEAMSAGCVPVVLARGGQVEIVEHGVSGFLWQTLDELKDYTLLLMHDRRLLDRMADAARLRAAHFSRPMFAARVRRALRPILPD